MWTIRIFKRAAELKKKLNKLWRTTHCSSNLNAHLFYILLLEDLFFGFHVICCLNFHMNLSSCVPFFCAPYVYNNLIANDNFVAAVYLSPLFCLKIVQNTLVTCDHVCNQKSQSRHIVEVKNERVPKASHTTAISQAHQTNKLGVWNNFTEFHFNIFWYIDVIAYEKVRWRHSGTKSRPLPSFWVQHSNNTAWSPLSTHESIYDVIWDYHEQNFKLFQWKFVLLSSSSHFNFENEAGIWSQNRTSMK